MGARSQHRTAHQGRSLNHPAPHLDRSPMDPQITVASHNADTHPTITNATGTHTIVVTTDVAAALGGQLISAAHVDLTHPVTFTGTTPPQTQPTPTEDPTPATTPPTSDRPTDPGPEYDSEPDPEPETLAVSEGLSVPARYFNHFTNDDEDRQDWTITPAAESQAANLGFTAAELIDAAMYPDDITPSGNDDVQSHTRGHVSVLVPQDRTLIIGCRREYGRAPTPQLRAPSGGPGRTTPTTTNELLRALHAHGFTVAQGRATSHMKITHPDKPGLTYSIGGTPSDSRSYLNSVTGIRRQFGIDITTRP